MNIPPFDKRFKKNHIHDIKIICLHHSFYKGYSFQYFPSQNPVNHKTRNG